MPEATEKRSNSTAATAAAVVAAVSSGSRPNKMISAKRRKLDNVSSGSSGSSDSSSEDEEDVGSSPAPPFIPDGWRVKLYRLNQDGSWDDCGTGRITVLYNKQQQQQTKKEETDEKPGSQQQQEQQQDWFRHHHQEATLCVQAEVNKTSTPRLLLRTRILLTRDTYQRQGDNIITWSEPCYYNNNNNTDNNNNNNARGGGGSGGEADNNNTGGVDLALSFQDTEGCLDILRQIKQVQARAAALLRQQPVEDLAAQAAAQHHADIQQRLQAWDLQMESNNNANNTADFGDQQAQQQQQQPALELSEQLPSPPTLTNLEDIADTIAALQHVQQREALAAWIAGDNECLYLKQLLALFPAAEARGDYGKLATLAACVKTILLLNDPSILELIVSVASIFEEVCSCLEYDPDLKEQANHRWFLRERARFRTVVPMHDPDLVAAIHRSFRVNYLRDTILRPTMDESSLSTLSSLQTFTHADVIKGVTMSARKDASLKDSYLVRVIRVLGIELHTLLQIDWAELDATAMPSEVEGELPISPTDRIRPDPSIVVGKDNATATWKQYLAPQDYSVPARRLRRRGCLSFLRELFNMVRLSLQQCDKDDFFSVICTLEVDLTEEREISDNVSQTSQQVEVGSVASTVRSDRLDEKSDEKIHAELPQITNLLSLLGNILADPNADTTEKGAVLEILSGVAMHDPSLLRRHCLDCHHAWKEERQTNSSSLVSGRPEPNEKKQVIFLAPPNDLLSSLLFLLDVETDAGVLLQVSEIMRIILDADTHDHGPLSPGFADEAEGIPPGSGQNPPHDQHNQPTGSGATSTDQKRFLSMFYDHYVEWLVVPFQFTILHPARRVPDGVLRAPKESILVQRFLKAFKSGIAPGDPWLRTVPVCAIRTSFTVELLSFCVRAHLYRMRSYLLKSQALGNVLHLLRPHNNSNRISGDRCLKLAALRFLRAILSVNDEMYHRHIIKHNLFAYVFEAFRANPVGDNLVSSAIVEMCDYIHSENIEPLLDYIVTKHLSANHPETSGPSLEDVSSPYVSTLSTLRKAYEKNIQAKREKKEVEEGQSSPAGSRYFSGGLHNSGRQLSGKALEDQRKFREVDEEESYFDTDDTEGSSPNVTPVVDEVEAQEKESEIHRTPRMLSLAQTPLLNLEEIRKERQTHVGDDQPNDQDLEAAG